jgi:hypothetical protein
MSFQMNTTLRRLLSIAVVAVTVALAGQSDDVRPTRRWPSC